MGFLRGKRARMDFRKLAMKFTLILSSVLILSWWQAKPVGGSFHKNSEIYNIGWIFSMPYDIGNTLRTPLGGPLSLILTACLSVIMFFGLAASPVWYLLGTPKRKYHTEDAIRTKPHLLLNPSSISEQSRSYPHPFDFFWVSQSQPEEPRSTPEDDDQLNYIDSIFSFLPSYEEPCKKLLTCHAHGFLSILPAWSLKTFRIFSSKMKDIPRDYQEAIHVGLEDQGRCAPVFRNCSLGLGEIAQKAFFHIILGDFHPWW